MTINNSINANQFTPLPIIRGGTGVNVATTTPTANEFSGWDINKNLTANNHINSYATTTTSAGVTTLTVGSAYSQFFTGTTTQTLVMPITSTLVLGQSWRIVNNSTGVVTVQSSGGNVILSMASGTQATLTCILTSGTTAASWNSSYVYNTGGVSSITGTANQVIASASTGPVTLSLPQSIANSSAVQFSTVQLNNNNGILDSNSNVILAVLPAASAVNHVRIMNNIAGFSPAIFAEGSDANVTLFLDGKGNAGCSIEGNTGGTNATPGYVGEYLTNNNSGVSLTTNVPLTITSLSLTAGDWDVVGNIGFIPAGTTNSTSVRACISTVNNTIQTNISLSRLDANLMLGMPQYQCLGPLRVNVSSNTTVYVVAQSGFTVSTMTANAIIAARRVR